jgi:hypothetical protein
MGNVLEMMPGQPDAKKLQLQAAQNIPGNPIVRVIDALGLPMFIGIVVVLLAVLAGLFVMMVNRKSVKPKGGAIRVQQAAAAAVAGSSPEKLPALTKAESYGSLHVTSGPLAGNRFPIPKQGLLIGRDPSRCAVVLTSDTASKEHAWVVPLDSGVVVIDRNSSNGTYVNSTDSPRISKVTLKNGDRIFIGSKNATEITYFNSNS